MRIGNRLFPYPTLNQIEALNEYIGNSEYKMAFDYDKDGNMIIVGENIILKNCRFILTDNELMDMYNSGVIKSVLVVESSASIYRKKYELTTEGQDIVIPLNDLKSNVFISSYLYAAEDIPDFYNSNFNTLYQDRTIPIEKYSILAVDDGIRFKADIDYTKDNRVASIFLLIQKDDAGDIATCSNDGKKIIIYLSPTAYQNYGALKSSTKYNNVFFAMLVIPFLAQCITDLQKQAFDSMADVYNNSVWMKSVALSYEKYTNKNLTIESFNDMPAVELAQAALNQAITRGVNDYCETVIKGTGGDDDDSD